MNKRYLVSRERFIAAPPEVIFELLATPATLHRLDRHVTGAAGVAN